MQKDHWLLHRFEEFNDKTAIIWKDKQVSYNQLLHHVTQWHEVLSDHQVRPGECVAIYGDYSPNVCALLLALFFNGNIVVPLSPAVAFKKTEFQQVANVSALFEFDDAGSWHFFRLQVETVHPLIRQLQEEGAPGLILFSSGSTGQRKASLLNLDKLVRKFTPRRRGYRTLIFLLLDHIGGINTLLYILSQGGTMVTIEDRRPERVCKAIEQYRVQLLPTTPTFLNMLLISAAYEVSDLVSLELITYGTEPMPASTLRHLCAVFPDVRFKQTYGLSEVGILSTQSQDSNSLLIKVGGDGYETKVIDHILWIKSATAMLGYLNAPSPFEADGWFNTGDVVEAHGEYLRILGRQSEIINVGGEKVYPAEVESVLLDLDNVEDVTVKGKANPVTGQVVVADIRLGQWEDPDLVRQRVRRFCKGRLDAYKIPVWVDIHDEPLHSARFKKSRVNLEV